MANTYDDQRTTLESEELSRLTGDLDDPFVLSESLEDIRNARSKSFVVDFNDQSSVVRFSISAATLTSLYDPATSAGPTTRWVNIWYPSQQADLLKVLAKRYDFSPRLLAFMTSDPLQPRRPHNPSSSTSTKRSWKRYIGRDEDKCSADVEDELSEHSYVASDDSDGRVNIYWLLKDVWHYSTVDFGRNYVCLGYNTLYGTKSTGHDRGTGPLPYCMRVWTWLLICDDHTVITVNEDPFPHVHGALSMLQRRILVETRRNLMSVFRSLSNVDTTPLMAKNPMLVLPIRIRLGETPEETAHRKSDAPGLLFYYLFENWHNSYTLVTRRESRYDLELQALRKQMFRRPKLDQIDRLDTIGKELGVLRRHYESYIRIINRLLDPIAPSNASLANSRIVDTSSQSSLATVKPIPTGRESSLGVSLSSAARVRFKRFRDMIELYAMSEVEEYLKQKESLVAMNFSLIAIRQSTDVDRLTRITLLLTKATILFLPVSLMTSYFSVNLVGVQYSVREFWIAFAVILFVSWLALFALGVFSGNMQSLEVWRSITRVLGHINRRRREAEADSDVEL